MCNKLYLKSVLFTPFCVHSIWQYQYPALFCMLFRPADSFVLIAHCCSQTIDGCNTHFQKTWTFSKQVSLQRIDIYKEHNPSSRISKSTDILKIWLQKQMKLELLCLVPVLLQWRGIGAEGSGTVHQPTYQQPRPSHQLFSLSVWCAGLFILFDCLWQIFQR